MKSKLYAVLMVIMTALVLQSCTKDEGVFEIYTLGISDYNESGSSKIGSQLEVIESYLKEKGCVNGDVITCRNRKEAIAEFNANVNKISVQELGTLITNEVSFTYALSATDYESNTTTLDKKTFHFNAN